MPKDANAVGAQSKGRRKAIVSELWRIPTLNLSSWGLAMVYIQNSVKRARVSLKLEF